MCPSCRGQCCLLRRGGKNFEEKFGRPHVMTLQSLHPFGIFGCLTTLRTKHVARLQSVKMCEGSDSAEEETS